jgi:hypothetical protein
MLRLHTIPPQNLSHVDFHIETSETFSRDSFKGKREMCVSSGFDLVLGYLIVFKKIAL